MSLEPGTQIDGERRLSLQETIDALRLALVSQKDPVRAVAVVEEILSRAPQESREANGGGQALMDLVLEGVLTFEYVE